MEYPKIETLYERENATHFVVDGKLRLPEFGLASRWLVTEKIDGTNVRIILAQGGEANLSPSPSVVYRGRTDAAQMPPALLDMLRERFPAEKVLAAFDPGTDAVIYGEGYGPKIQKGGGNYRSDPGFRVFDVVVFGSHGRLWWLNWGQMEDVARKIGTETVPVIAKDVTLSEAVEYVVHRSDVASLEKGDDTVPQEGIVARTDPLLFMRNGQRLVWKLKKRDFVGGAL